nr:ribonuclease H-like domain-containing protein [Tanacetum cinerariifolium]
MIMLPLMLKKMRMKFMFLQVEVTRLRNMMTKLNEMIQARVWVNAASAPVTAAGPNQTNSTNSFNIASPSDTAVSVYVDDVVFGSTNKELCKAFEKLMKDKFQGNLQQALKDKGVIDSGCSRHMTGNISFLLDFEEFNRGYVAFGGNPKGGKISRKGKIKIGKLDFDDVNFIKELKFNLFSVSQMCDKKNIVLFTDTECVVLSSDYKLPDENHVLLRVPRENNMYNVDLKNVVPLGDLTCLFSKAILDESNLQHRRLGHINFKTMNKHVKGNIVRGLPSNIFKNNHTCVACKKGKQHKASYPSKYPDDLDMPKLEDIVYSDDNEDVGVEADFSNLETNISLSPILATRVHKDHHVT